VFGLVPGRRWSDRTGSSMGSVQEALWEKVRATARGQRSDYSLGPAPIGVGGQAEVYRATHKPTGIWVAFKRLLRRRDTDAVARMRREIEVGMAIRHPNVMPILDADEGATWLVMPLALDNLERRREEILRSDQLRVVISQVSAGLAAAHALGWVHRDIKPSNVLLLEPEQWVIADWGLVRRPIGSTTTGARTRVGVSYGTEGFAPPELSHDAHAATVSADVYYVGQLIGWCLLGTWPLQNVPLLPPEGPWRSVVRAATNREPSRRPQTMDELTERIDRALYRPPDPPQVHAKTLLEHLGRSPSNDNLVDELLDLVQQDPANTELCVDLLPQLTRDQLERGIHRHPDRGAAIVEALRMEAVEWGDRPFRWADNVILALLYVASAAAEMDDLNLLEEAVTAMFAWDGSWDQWPPQGPIRHWLRSLRGSAAGVVAQVLLEEPNSARHFSEVANDARADGRVRDAIRRASNGV
jgi:serine/threonine protein kinase